MLLITEALCLGESHLETTVHHLLLSLGGSSWWSPSCLALTHHPPRCLRLNGPDNWKAAVQSWPLAGSHANPGITSKYIPPPPSLKVPRKHWQVTKNHLPSLFCPTGKHTFLMCLRSQENVRWTWDFTFAIHKLGLALTGLDNFIPFINSEKKKQQQRVLLTISGGLAARPQAGCQNLQPKQN